MKIMHEQVGITDGSPLKMKWDDFPHFSFPWHYHGEYEILYNIKSYGIRYVGDNVSDFSDHCMALIGSNIPHFWKSAPEFHEKDSSMRVNALVVHFPGDFLQTLNGTYPEFHNINMLLQRAERGICFNTKASKVIGERLLQLLQLKGLERLLAFIKILEEMALSKDYRLLTSAAYKTSVPIGVDQRLSKILNFIQLNYQEELEVNALARKFSMNTSAFCRYFKDNTSKTVVQYINEMRIGYACKLLMGKAMTISEICYESGFNNIANFNRIFRRINGCSPSEFRKKIKGK